MSYGSNWYRAFKWFGPGGRAWNTHPSQSDWDKQQRLWWYEPYKTYMTGKSQNEKNANTRSVFNVDWNKIKYPYLSEVADKSTANFVSGVANSAKSIEGLYGQSARAIRKNGGNRNRRRKRRTNRRTNRNFLDDDFRHDLTWSQIIGER